ncbi:Gfo/Idh/MocA family oxidoreductase [Actinopolyspora sp. BKK2]|uniref:Gfo/Idh/MocA family oxidoreductase n=1 Tax=Actinopolyspora sp. BKK2 TaxID=2599395 RepID=UPI0013F5E06D
MSRGRVWWGVLGCADVARRRVLPALVTVPGVELVAVASRERERAEEFVRGTGAAPVQGYRELLERDDIDAVYVPLPAGLHAPWIRQALLNDKHVLAEKPMTTDLAESRRLVELARSRGLVLRENYMFVHHPSHARIREMVAQGSIGELRSFSATFAIPRRPDRDIRLRPELGGGALLDVGGYPLRAAQLFLGPGLRVAGAALRPGASGVDVGGEVILESRDGVLAQAGFGLEHHYTSRYELIGSCGSMLASHVFTPPTTHRPMLRLEVGERQEEILLPAFDQYQAAISTFVQAIVSGPLVDPTIEAQAELVSCARSLAGSLHR